MCIKKIGWVPAAFLFLFCELSVCEAADYGNDGGYGAQEEIDIIKEGDVNVLVPKGGRLRKESSFLVKEDADAYASRKYIETQFYLKKLEKELQAQKMELKKMAEIIEEMRKEKESTPAP